MRLYKGDYAKMTVYSEDPPPWRRTLRPGRAADAHRGPRGARDGGHAGTWASSGASQRRQGSSSEVRRRAADMAAIDRAFAAGVRRVILGTAAVSDERLLAESVQKYGER